MNLIQSGRAFLNTNTSACGYERAEKAGFPRPRRNQALSGRKNPFDRFIAFWAVFRSHRTCCRESARLAMGETLSKYDFMTNDAFQSTRPSRGETTRLDLGIHQLLISIHSPLAGRDRSENDSQQRSRNFNPPAPRGARRPWGLKCATFSAFQSTRPSRGETAEAPCGDKVCKISIHSPLAGRDL